MKNFAFILLCIFGMTFNATAQEKMASKDKEATMKDYERYIDSRLALEYRNSTFEALELTSDEIKAFDPVFNRYLDKKDDLLEKKMKLIEEYQEEMAEDDSAKDEADETADFIEDYWEVEIAEMELKKDYFDIFEDKIPVDKAIRFFLWEEAVEAGMKRDALVQMIPMIVTVQKVPSPRRHIDKDKAMNHKNGQMHKDATQCISDYNAWVTSDRGAVNIYHEYTSNGLKSLVTAVSAVNREMKINDASFKAKKSMVMDVAEKLKVNPESTDHADMTRKAFIAVAEMMASFDTYTNDVAARSGNLKAIAQRMNPDQLMTKQANTIYSFFDQANRQLQQINTAGQSSK